jgi:hypothetical protein
MKQWAMQGRSLTKLRLLVAVLAAALVLCAVPPISASAETSWYGNGMSSDWLNENGYTITVKDKSLNEEYIHSVGFIAPIYLKDIKAYSGGGAMTPAANIELQYCAQITGGRRTTTPGRRCRQTS